MPRHKIGRLAYDLRENAYTMRVPFDYHIHTSFSRDADATMETMCRAAMEAGIPEIGFSDHLDMVPEDPCSSYFKADTWWHAFEHCRDAFRGSLTLRAGVEVGEPHLFPTQVERLLDSYPWDYCMGSLHWVGDRRIFDPAYFERPAEEAYGAYFEELTRMVRVGIFDILGHMDIAKRYGYDAYGSYDPATYESQIRRVLREAASRDLAIEVNTATLRRSVQQTTPDRKVLCWFRQEGGRWVTLGSDAHTPEQVGHGLDQALRDAIQAGFHHLARFEGRRPFKWSVAGGGSTT